MKKVLDCKTNSPCQKCLMFNEMFREQYRECTEHTDVWVRGVKSENPASHHSMPIPTLVHNSFLSLSLHGSV